MIPHTALVQSTQAEYRPVGLFATAPARGHAFRVFPALMVTVAAAAVVSASLALHGLAERSSSSVGKLKAALPAVTARLVIPVASGHSGLGWQQRPTPSATRAPVAPVTPYAPYPPLAEPTGFLSTMTMGMSASASAGVEETITAPPGPTPEPGTVPQIPPTEPTRSPTQTSGSEADDDSSDDETEDTEDEEAEPSAHEDEQEPDVPGRDSHGDLAPGIGQ